VVPTLEDVTTLLRLLPRSATGQAITNYVSLTTGVRGDGERDGPEHFHIVLVDNGRTRLLGSELRPMLRCIRCGACMNHCPVYQAVGGHAYGWVYPGPMGSILTPSYVGLENAADLPFASTLCNQCGVVCPVKIPLPELQRKLREQAVARKLRPWSERFGLRAWAWFALRPRLYALGTRLAARLLGAMGGRDGLLHRLPPGGAGWTRGRDLPAPEGRTFRELYRARTGG
jgi:L-lactate dehydrogenase complex protein LldF